MQLKMSVIRDTMLEQHRYKYKDYMFLYYMEKCFFNVLEIHSIWTYTTVPKYPWDDGFLIRNSHLEKLKKQLNNIVVVEDQEK